MAEEKEKEVQKEEETKETEDVKEETSEEETKEETSEDKTTEETSDETTSDETTSGEESSKEEASAEEAAEEAAEDDTEENEDTEGDETAGSDKNRKKVTLFGKKEKDKEREKLKEQVDELSDRVMRQMAEFENFRKRTEKEKQVMFETGAKSVIEKLLPVVDNFERGLSGLSEDDKEDAFAQGMLLIYKQLIQELEKLEVKPIEAVGKEFDPNLHNAVMHVDDEEQGENIVVEEFQKGYTYRDTVVRHSMVKVAN